MRKSKKSKRKKAAKNKGQNKEKVLKVVDNVPIVEETPVKVKDNKESYHTMYNRKKKIEKNMVLSKRFGEIMKKIGKTECYYKGDHDCGFMKMKAKLLDHFFDMFDANKRKVSGLSKKAIASIMKDKSISMEERRNLVKALGDV